MDIGVHRTTGSFFNLNSNQSIVVRFQAYVDEQAFVWIGRAHAERSPENQTVELFTDGHFRTAGLVQHFRFVRLFVRILHSSN